MRRHRRPYPEITYNNQYEAETIVDVNSSCHDVLGYDLDTIRELGIKGLSVTETGYTSGSVSRA